MRSSDSVRSKKTPFFLILPVVERTRRGRKGERGLQNTSYIDRSSHGKRGAASAQSLVSGMYGTYRAATVDACCMDAGLEGAQLKTAKPVGSR